MKKILSLILFIILGFLLQCCVFKAILPKGITPNIMVIITACQGFINGKKDGMWTGFFCGLLTDIFFGGSILGFYALLYMLVGYINGTLKRFIYPEEIFLPIAFVALSDLALLFSVYILRFLLRARFNLFTYFRKIMLPEVVNTILITVIIYKIILIIQRKRKNDDINNEAKFV